MSEVITPEQCKAFDQFLKAMRTILIAITVGVNWIAWMVVYTEVWQPHLQRDFEQRVEMQRQFAIAREAEMLVAPPHWTIKDDCIEVYTLTPPAGSFDREIELSVPRKALSVLWNDGEFQNGVEGKKIKFHYRKSRDVINAGDEWDLVEASVVK
ncbi:MAG: hypothetical protein NTY30_02130 [Candidatus Berkelbacteria bacterium]|nr:hypothetical protein [Candidatus Berkelbacteria bacterium]